MHVEIDVAPALDRTLSPSISSPRAKNGNYCRPTIADLFFFFLHQLVAREPAIYSIFFSHSIPIFAHLRYVPPSIYIYSSNSRIYLKRYIRISILKKRTACRERRMEAINPLKDHGENVTNHLQTDDRAMKLHKTDLCTTKFRNKISNNNNKKISNNNNNSAVETLLYSYIYIVIENIAYF